jgi:hypothetical protein
MENMVCESKVDASEYLVPQDTLTTPQFFY